MQVFTLTLFSLLIKYVTFYRSVFESWTEVLIMLGQFFKLCRENFVRNLTYLSTVISILLSGDIC